MTYLVLVEPSDEQKAAFARWCLAQNPRIETVSASGSEVPADLFTGMPEELLVGAYIDGRLYRHVVEEVGPADVPQVVKRAQRRKAAVTEVTE